MRGRSRGSLKSQQMGGILRKLITLLLTTSLLVGCTSTTEFGDASSGIQDSQETRSAVEEEGGLTEEERQALLDRIAEEEALAAELKMNTENAEQRNDAASELRRRVALGEDGAELGVHGLKWWPHTQPLDCDQKNFSRPTSLDNLDVCGTFLSAWSQLWEQMDDAKVSRLDINFYVSPATEKTDLALDKALLERASLLWGANFWPSGRGRIVYVTPGSQSELDWFERQISQFGGLRYMLDADEIENWYWGPEKTRSCGALASQGDNYYPLLSCIQPTTPGNLKVTPHEYTHWYYGQFGELNNEGPLWFIEGAPEFFGMAIGFKDEPLAVPYRSNIFQFHSGGSMLDMGDQLDLLTTLQTMTESEFIELMTRQEDKWSGSASFAYFIGGMASEALLAVYGADKVDEFARTFAMSSNWKPAFKRVFGLDVEDFYAKLLPYVAQTAKEMRVLD